MSDLQNSVQPLSEEDERLWAMLAHLSILVNLVSGFLGTLGVLLIYLVYKDRSRYVAFQSMQAFLFQIIFWIGGGVLVSIVWVVTGFLSVILIGILCIPLAALLTLIPVAAVVYGVVGGIQAYQGVDFRYWLIGDWVNSSVQV